MRGHLCSPSYFAVSCRGAPLSIIKQNIHGQVRPLQRAGYAGRRTRWANPPAEAQGLRPRSPGHDRPSRATECSSPSDVRPSSRSQPCTNHCCRHAPIPRGDAPPDAARARHNWQVFGLTGAQSVLLAVASQPQIFVCIPVPLTAFVRAYSCGTVPDSHRVPSRESSRGCLARCRQHFHVVDRPAAAMSIPRSRWPTVAYRCGLLGRDGVARSFTTMPTQAPCLRR
jgi:hypothetical protein